MMPKNTALFAFARNLKTADGGANLKTDQDIKNAQRHAERRDRTSARRRRAGGKPSENLCWSKMGVGFRSGGTNYEAAFKQHKHEHQVISDTNGAKALHLLVGVSPDWLSETGDLHDPDNPRIKQLIEAAVLWAEEWGGVGCVWGWRYDLDEKGGGIVDILSSPIRTDARTKDKRPKISIAKALRELQEKHGRRLSYEAMQDDWSKFAQSKLDSRLKRGEPGQEHIDATIFAQYAENEREKVRSEVHLEAAEIIAAAKNDASKVLRKTRVRSERELNAIARKRAKAEREAALEIEAAQSKAKAETDARTRQLEITASEIVAAKTELAELRGQHARTVQDLEMMKEKIESIQQREIEVSNAKVYLDQVFGMLRRLINKVVEKLGISIESDILEGLRDLERDVNVHLAQEEVSNEIRPRFR